MASGYSQANTNFQNNNSTSNIIETIIITSSGSSVDWGSELYYRSGTGVSNSTRGIIGAGVGTNPADFPGMMHTTIESSGHFVTFGDLSTGRFSSFRGASCTLTRGVFAGGVTPTYINVIDYIQFSSLGDAIDFGDLTGMSTDSDVALQFGGNVSNAHGGLGLGGF